jgi:GT2 family glycosyltransferase
LTTPRARHSVPTPAALQAAPAVSVCIANWNCRDLLRACLTSLCDDFQGVRFEIIVVDNASTDGAADMVAREFPDVVLVRSSKNRGFATACNQAARLASGRYLFFLNNDTAVPAGTLRRLLDYAEAHPEAGMIGPRLVGPDGRPQVSCRPRPTVATLLHRAVLLRWTGLLKRGYRRYRREPLPADTSPRKVETLMGAAVFLRRQLFFDVGGWDEDFTFGGEDFDLSFRIGKRLALVYLPEITLTHHCRVSTRANVGYSAPLVAIGFLRFLRKSGASRSSLLLYKVIMSIDAPLLLFLRLVALPWRWARGQSRQARQTVQRMKESWFFLTRGLIDFWRV